MVTHLKINNSIFKNSEKKINKKVEQDTIKEREFNEQPQDEADEQPQDEPDEQSKEVAHEQSEEVTQEQSEEVAQEQSEEVAQEQSEDVAQEQSEDVAQELPKRESFINCSSPESNSEDEQFNSEKICRICYDEEKDEKLISPCKCSGSVKWVHHSCLQKWIDISHNNKCSACKYTYQYKKKYKRDLYKHLDHTYVPKVLTIVFILITTIMSGLISKLLMKLLKFNNKIKIGFNLKYLFFSLKYFSLLFFVSLPFLHYLKIINIRDVYTNYISLYERNNTIYGQGASDISIFIYLTVYKFFEKNINKLTESEKVIMDYVPDKKK